jgi:hypothetical protein
MTVSRGLTRLGFSKVAWGGVLPKVIPPNETFTIEALSDGTFRLIPMTMIPTHRLWAWHPEVQEAVEKALLEPGVSLDSPEGQAFMQKLAK